MKAVKGWCNIQGEWNKMNHQTLGFILSAQYIKSYLYVCFNTLWSWPSWSNKVRTLKMNSWEMMTLNCLTLTTNTTAQGLFIVFNHVEMKARGGWLLVIWLISIISYQERVCPFLLLGWDRNKLCFYCPQRDNELLLASHRGLHHHTYFHVTGRDVNKRENSTAVRHTASENQEDLPTMQHISPCFSSFPL